VGKVHTIHTVVWRESGIPSTITTVIEKSRDYMTTSTKPDRTTSGYSDELDAMRSHMNAIMRCVTFKEEKHDA